MNRTDVPWPVVQRRWEAGESSGSLGRAYGVSRQAIDQRRRREGWTRTDDAAALAETATAKMLEHPETRWQKRMAKSGTRNLSSMLRVIDIAAAGGSMALAAARIGVNRDTLADWIAADPAFAQQIEAARAEISLRRIAAVDGAAERGDWRASAWLLERDPQTRADFAPAENVVPAGPGVTIHLVLPGAIATPLQRPATAPTIDHSPNLETD